MSGAVASALTGAVIVLIGLLIVHFTPSRAVDKRSNGSSGKT